jgi:hypothetical protein
MSNNGDNASTTRGQNEHTSGVSGLPQTPHCVSPRKCNHTELFSSPDKLEHARRRRPPELPTSLPPRHPDRIQEPSQPRRPEPRHRPIITHNGTEEGKAKSEEGTARVGCPEKLQRTGCDGDELHCRLAVHGEKPG